MAHTSQMPLWGYSGAGGWDSVRRGNIAMTSFRKANGHSRGLMTSQVFLDRFAAEAAASLVPGSRVLDAGAGDSPYRSHFRHVIYEAADVCVRDSHTYENVHIVCDLTAIPVEANRYDLVLCTQVLEHVPKPLDVLREFARVLKPGCRLWITAPLYFEEHEVPYDYYRYTQYAWKYMLNETGFDIERLDWVQGYFGTLSHQLNLARRALPVAPADFGGGPVGVLVAGLCVFLRPGFGLLAWIFARLDLRHRYQARGHCQDYCVVAVKRPLAC